MLVVINDENDPESAWEIWDEDNLIGCAYGDTGESQDEVVARAKTYAEAGNMLHVLEVLVSLLGAYEGSGVITVNIPGKMAQEIRRITGVLTSSSPEK